jgi:hypothetical protein
MVRAGRLGCGIILFVLGFTTFGIGYQIKSNAETSFSLGQCNNILGEAVAALYQPQADVCMKAQNMTTYGLMGEIAGGIMIIAGIVFIALSFARKDASVKEAATETKVEYNIPSTQPCKACGQKIKWNQISVVEGPDPETVKS